jgi:AraC-like DNA-binding protein
MGQMPSYRPPATPAQRRHHDAALAHAERHFTDPDMKANDAAILQGISERVLRDSLEACGTSWRAITMDLRMGRAERLLAETKYEIWAVARMCGYRSAPAFAKAFARRHGVSPARWRVRKGGPARAGGPTGAFYKPAARAQALKAGDEPPASSRRSMTPGEHAIQSCEIDEAHARIDDWRILHCEWGSGVSIQELAEESMHPRHLSDRPASYWRARAVEFDVWVTEHEKRLTRETQQRGDGDALWEKVS